MTTSDSNSSGMESSGTVKSSNVFQRLHTGSGALDIVGKRKRWYLILGLLVVVCIASMALRGFNLGIDFEGGTKIQLPTASSSGAIEVPEVKKSFHDALGKPAETVQSVGAGDNQSIQIRSESLNSDEVRAVKDKLFQELQPLGPNGQPSQAVISDSAVSGTWGGEITQQALIALGVFLVLVTVFLTFYFERWMAVAALIALLQDVVVTAGLYSLIGFEVTPGTVIGLLTILGFSLYDTVVVFDKVKENTRGLLGLTRRTYAEAANLAVNQTLMRSINTSIVALLPVIGLLVVGSGLLGVGVLRDLALVQLIGMSVGVISSVLLATPLLVEFKMRDPKYQAHNRKVRQRRERQAGVAPTGDEDTATSVADRTPEPSTPPQDTGKPAKANETKRQSRPSGKSARPTGKKRR